MTPFLLSGLLFVCFVICFIRSMRRPLSGGGWRWLVPAFVFYLMILILFVSRPAGTWRRYPLVGGRATLIQDTTDEYVVSVRYIDGQGRDEVLLGKLGEDVILIPDATSEPHIMVNEALPRLWWQAGTFQRHLPRIRISPQGVVDGE